jgi:DNA-binding transcriptional LysR family regulator
MDRRTTMEAFVRVVEAGSFTAAARQWSVSKAVVSKYVAALERELGVELLRRTTRSSSLTDAGRTYYDRCSVLLEELSSLEASLRDEYRGPRGRLRVTAPPGFVARYGDLITTAFRRRYQQIDLDLLLTHRMVDLIEERIDVAIRVTDPGDSTLVARRLAPAPVVAVASPKYLRRRGTPRTPDELSEHDCLVDTNFREQGRWRFYTSSGRGRRRSVAVDGPYRADSPLVIRDLAVAGEGIALIARFIVEHDLAAGRLHEILVGQAAYAWSIYALYPRREHLSGRVRAFVDHLTEGLES